VKRLVLLALAGIFVIGVGAAALIHLLPGAESFDASWTGASVPAPPEPKGVTVPRTPPSATPVDPPGSIASMRAAVAGPRRLQLPDRIAARDVTTPVADCLRAHPTNPGGGAVLMLDLEALEGGGVRIVDAPVTAWGNASRALVDCAQGALRGRIVAVGEYPAGERLRARYALESVIPEAEPPPASTLTARQPPRRASGGSRR
jgi:hypothetical protein